jgi:hypothetical protein
MRQIVFHVCAAAVIGTFAASMAFGDAASEAVVQQQAAKAYAETSVAPFLKDLTVLTQEVNKANAERASWKAFAEKWKSWAAADAESNKTSYDWCEYQWSVVKDKAFRSSHMTTAAATALKEFKEKSGGRVAEFFVTDAKGGNVVQAQVTSDWFQGDEDKFSKVVDKHDFFCGEPKRDDTVGETGVHVSLPLWDGDKFVGVAVVLVIIEKL